MPESALRRGLRCLAFALLALVAGPAAALQVVDDRGITVTLAQPARRVVSLLPSLTESVCALGACERLVGVDDYSNWPSSVRALPRLGGLDDVRIETIVGLQPDLVLLSTTSPARARLQALGIPVFGLDVKTLADLQRSLVKTGKLLGVDGAARVWQQLQDGLAAAAGQLPAAARGTTVYFEVSSGPYAASAASHIGELLARVGAVNVVPAELGSVPKLNPEFVVRADPQVVMVSGQPEPPLRSRPGWERIRAVRDGRVCTFSAAQADVITRPGPRLAEGALLLVACLAGRSGGRAP